MNKYIPFFSRSRVTVCTTLTTIKIKEELDSFLADCTTAAVLSRLLLHEQTRSPWLRLSHSRSVACQLVHRPCSGDSSVCQHGLYIIYINPKEPAICLRVSCQARPTQKQLCKVLWLQQPAAGWQTWGEANGYISSPAARWNRNVTSINCLHITKSVRHLHSARTCVLFPTVGGVFSDVVPSQPSFFQLVIGLMWTLSCWLASRVN